MERETTSSRGSSRKLSLEQIAAMTNATINKIHFSNSRERLRNGTTVTYHDCTSVGYGWLLPDLCVALLGVLVVANQTQMGTL
ncbi:uncharacterized protein HKW66_Vig0107270 [Vigna angularis]|uniref:Uncharacterized protein n=1 Tax=Phaseolus angularis TaxID=3914 RepID=A0A8T0KV39_PHAAN|nr:uncharacterized protein HKW66_Vig0107270 [Vigna angularis]